MKYHILCKQDGVICIGVSVNSTSEWVILDCLDKNTTPVAFNIFKAKEFIEEQKTLDVSPWDYWLEPAN